MSISPSGKETRRATANITVPTGQTENIAEIQATEDRLLVGILASSDGGTTSEFSFSASEEFLTPPGGTASTDDTRSSVIVARAATSGLGAGNLQQFDSDHAPPIEWGEGEEIHIHTENETGSANAFVAIIYYTEV